ncbi:MAG: OmpA family protein [Woeseiaceae bacterium]
MWLNRHLLGAALCAILGFITAQARQTGDTPVDQASVLTIDIDQSSVTIRGVVSSVAHESILRQRALALFPDKTRSFHVMEQPSLRPGWALLTEVTLRAVAESYYSTTRISETLISITGITNSESNWQPGLMRIHHYLLPGMGIEHRMSEIGSLDSHADQCAVLFDDAMRDYSVEFPRSGTALGPSARPFLDTLVQIAVDCPSAHFRITGHTDNTGNEPSNVALSLARAEAVAHYMQGQGIRETRINVSGAGSARPLTDGQSRQDLKLNRRIEIEMVFPGV